MKACEVVGVSRRTIYNWISAGKVEYVRTAGGSIRIFADTLWRDAAAPTRVAGGQRHADRRTPRVNVVGALSGRRRRRPLESESGTARAVPPAEQSAGDHPGARGAARGQGADDGHRARAAQVVSSALDAMDDRTRNPPALRSRRRLSPVPNQHIRTATRRRAVQTATQHPNSVIRHVNFLAIAPGQYRQTVDVLGSVETRHAYSFGCQ